MIDLHSHILPGIDDGPASMEQSLEMAGLYAAAGFETVVATPHFIPGSSWMPDVRVIREKTAALNQAMEDRGIDLAVLAGMEVGLDNSVPALLQKEALLTLGEGAYVLLEAPFQRFPVGWEQIIFQVMSAGFKVLLAHPERCDQIVRDRALADELIQSGVYMQVTFDSCLGNHGREIRDTAFSLAEKRYIHCLATDSHEHVHRSPQNATRGIEVLRHYLGMQDLDLLTRLNPQRVLNGLPLETVQGIKPRSRKKRWIWSKKS